MSDIEHEPEIAASLRGRHEALRDLLSRNGTLLELLADIQFDLRLLVPGDPAVRARTRQLLDATLLQAQTLNILSGGRFERLYDVHQRLEQEIHQVLGDERRRLRSDPIAVPLATCRRADEALVGGKAARLGELAGRLPEHVPGGFVITTAAHARFLAHGRTGARLRDVINAANRDASALPSLAARARSLVLEAPIPAEIVDALRSRARALRTGALWAVRSSAVGEDGPSSYAGQFATILSVPEDDLPSAWRRVVGSSFSEHVIRYQLACGQFELATPMAVLCMPMVPARLSGVLYTRDPADIDADTMLVSSLAGLGEDLVGGVADADSATISRRTLRVEATGERLAGGAREMSEDELSALGRLGLECEGVLGNGLDLEWAIADDDRIRLLQGRALTATPAADLAVAEPTTPAVARGGTTVVGGRAMGVTHVVESTDEEGEVPEGCILVVPQAAARLAHLLPKVEGVVAEHGSAAGHLAALAREFGVPSVFGMPEVTTRLNSGERVSLDAGHCAVYQGKAWLEQGGEFRRRARERRSGARSPLHRLILRLELTDPRAASFSPAGCRSLHDVVRLCHERGVASLFERPQQQREAQRSGALRLLGSALSEDIWVLDAGGGIAPGGPGADGLEPDQVLSRPFRALWRGVSAPGIEWSGRRVVDARGFASVMSASLTEADHAADSLGGASYLIVASDYVNFNARMAYHYAVIDALVDEIPENNDVSFRFWGGGAGRAQRNLRALFLAGALSRLGFVVERRGDLVTARLRRYPQAASEKALEALGRLMGCARQLDMLLHSEADASRFVEHFVAGRYEEFA